MAWVFAVALLGLIGVATYFILEQQKSAEKRSRALALIGAEKNNVNEKIKAKDKSNRADIAKRLKTGTLNTGEKINKKSIKILLMQICKWYVHNFQYELSMNHL
jgi:Flp pilus assembly protein TadB